MIHPILKLINDYWKFDNNQQPTSSWHDKQDLLIAIEKELSAQQNYVRPRSFLEANEIEFEQLQMKSNLNGEFENCLEQWSLSVEGSDFKYSDDSHEDYRKLKAKFQKWINSWIQNKNKINGKKQSNSNIGRIDRETISNYVNRRED